MYISRAPASLRTYASCFALLCAALFLPLLSSSLCGSSAARSVQQQQQSLQNISPILRAFIGVRRSLSPLFGHFPVSPVTADSLPLLLLSRINAAEEFKQ